MSDAGEGLIDNDSRIQERMDELARDKRRTLKPRDARDPELMRALESLRLARKELERQLAATNHAGRRAQLADAIAEIDRRAASLAADPPATPAS